MPRLTKDVRQKMLEQNEGRTIRTSFSSRNASEDRIYKIKGGKLFIREIGNSSWSDSRYNEEREASDKEIHTFLYRYQDDLDYEE